MEYKTDEAQNMQWQTNDTLTLSFTPRIENGAFTITVSASSSVVPRRTARPEGYAFTPIAGLVSPYFSIPLVGRKTKIEMSVRQRRIKAAAKHSD